MIILTIYALIDVKFRFSRALILLGAAYTMLVMLFSRLILHWFRKYSNYSIYSRRENRIAIVGEITEAQRVKSILSQINIKTQVIGFISPNGEKNNCLGTLKQIDEIVKIHKIDEVIFCAKNLSTENIISKMLTLSSLNINVKIAPEDSISIIGSNSINTAGDLYTINLNTISKAKNQRFKVLFDKLTAFLLLIFYPLVLWFVKNKIGLIKNIILVFIGKYSWVGYQYPEIINESTLPKIKKGVLSLVDTIKIQKPTSKIKQNLNVSYAKNYRVSTDFFVFFKGFKHLGRNIY